MKRTIAPATLVILFATMFVLGVQPQVRTRMTGPKPTRPWRHSD
jgi:hypothetical protein